MKEPYKNDPAELQIKLLMEEIPNNHLGCIKPCKYNGMKQPINWLARFLPSTVLTIDTIDYR